jgi:hypothetical protein
VAVLAKPSVVFSINTPPNINVGQDAPISWLPTTGASYYQLYLDNTLLPVANETNALLNIGFEGAHTLLIAACNATGCGPLSAPVNLQVAPNPGPVAADKTLIVTQQSTVVQQDLALLVADLNGIDWSTLHLLEPAFGKVAIEGTVLTVDYSAAHLDGQERIEYRVNDLLGVSSNTGFITLNVKVLQTPSVPEQLRIAELSPSEELSFTWQTPEGVGIRYHIEHQHASNPWQVLQEASIERQISVLKPLNGLHRFKVKACRVTHSLCSDYAQSDDLLIANTPLPITNILSPTVVQQGKIRLQWLAADNATHYDIEQQKNSQGWALLQEDVSGTMLMVNTDGNGQFKFKIAACNSVGCSVPVVSSVAEIAIIPDAPAVVNIIPEGANAKLNWSQVELADWYLVQTYISSQWQGVNGNNSQAQYNGSTLLLTPKPSGNVRVLACNNVDCSISATLAVTAQPSATPINTFYADQSVLGVGHKTTIHWEVNDAVEVSIQTDADATYSNLPAIGSLMIAPEQTTRYSLHAKENADATAYSQFVDVVVGEPGDDIVAVLPSNPTISPIVSSIMVEANGNRTFGDLQGWLINVDAQGNILWQQDNAGMLYSPPVVRNDKMYFSATANDGKGQFCRIDLSGNNLHCISLPQPIIGAPIITGTQAWVVDLYGGASSIDLASDNVTSLAQMPVGKQVRSTPVRTTTNTLVVRTTQNDIYTLDLNATPALAEWTLSLAGEQE